MRVPFNYGDCTEEQLWRHVAGHLEESGVHVVLVGGAVVSVYSRGAYRSGDLDFVQEGLFGASVEECMAELGFGREGRYFVHPDCEHLFVEFVAGPLGIGDDLDIVPATEVQDGNTLRILSPTDCVRDRLASYIHFKTRDCLAQAALVAAAQPVDWGVVEDWCLLESSEGEGVMAKLRRLVDGLKGSPGS